MTGSLDVLVLGGGVVGLSAALRLREAGRRVRLWSADAPEDTVSAVAGAFWYPYRAFPAERVDAWGSRTFGVLAELAAVPGSGVRMRPALELRHRPAADPSWAGGVPGFRHARPDELPPGYADGWAFTVPTADMPAYLRWLAGRFRAAGGEVERRRARSLEEARAAAPTVLNCTGLGARSLAGDASVFPIRGQVVRVENPGVERILLDQEHPEGITYVIPRSDRECVLGGTAEDGSWDAAPDPATARRILRLCAELEPRLAGARVLEHRVGLRPGRPEVRLEAEDFPDGSRVVHCYGHGGSGLTLSWGCAEEAVALAAATPP
ncbi:MAG TPA: FAD-dependent oxidoreductase, partial [Longimicrobiaceae bacterium]|nr:FAD-dependent oxidoreductase [Longimicrobiaceae bacterium]